MSSFLSRFKTKKDRPASASAPKSVEEKRQSIRSALEQTSPSFLPLDLPNPSLLDDSVLSTPSALRSRGESSSVRSDASPWVKVEEVSVEAEGPKGRQEREAKEKARCDRAVFGIDDATVLMQECGAVIRNHGLTTLGLFRPYRLAESPSEILRLSLLFLSYASDQTSSAGTDSVARDLFGAGSKKGKLENFRSELRFARVVDVVAVLKWGLRHLVLSAPFGGSSTSDHATPSSDPASPLAWYGNFLLSSAENYHSTSAFPLLLLPSLPPSSGQFLVATLDLLQAVAAHVEENAMGSRKLCRTLGLYVFGLAPKDRKWTGWEELYALWQAAGDTLEGCLRAYLRSQASLPPRLMDIIEGYPGPSPSTTTGGRESLGQQRKVLRVELESKGDWKEVGEEDINSQESGRVEGGSTGSGVWARREPLEVLQAAFGATSDDSGADEEEPRRFWSTLVTRGEKDGAQAVLSEETVRILKLVGLNQLPGDLTQSPTGDSGTFFAPSSPSRGARSLSVSDAPTTDYDDFYPAPYTSNSSTLRPKTSANFPYPSPHFLGNDQQPTSSSSGETLRVQIPQRKSTPSWSDFASTGFGSTSNAGEFGLISPGLEEFPSRGGASRAEQLNAPRRRVKPRTALLKICFDSLDDEFVDAWLDTLADHRGACVSWPSLLVAQLNADLASQLQDDRSEKVDHLLIFEQLVSIFPTAPPPPPTSIARNLSFARKKAPSVAESTVSRKWRRASALFSSGTGAPGRLLHSNSSTPTVSPRKPKQSAIPPLPTSPKLAQDASSAPAPAQGPPTALGSLVSRTMGRRKSSKNDLARPTSPSEAPPPVPPLPSTSPMMTSAPTTPDPDLGGPSTPSSVRSSVKEKKLPRVAVPTFDPAGQDDHLTSAGQAREAQEVLQTDLAPDAKSTVSATQNRSPSLDVPTAIGGEVIESSVGAEDGGRKQRDSLDDTRGSLSDASANVPPAIEVDVAQMERSEPLADLAEAASLAADATEDTSEMGVSGAARPTSLGDDSQMDIAQFVQQDEAIAAAEASAPSSSFPTPVVSQPPTLETVPSTSSANVSIPDASAIEALISSPPTSASVTPLAEVPESTALSNEGSSIVTSQPLDQVEHAPFDSAAAPIGAPTFELSPPPAVAHELAARASHETMRPIEDRAGDSLSTSTMTTDIISDPMESPVAGREPAGPLLAGASAEGTPVQPPAPLPSSPEQVSVTLPPSPGLVATPLPPDDASRSPASPTLLPASAELSRSFSETSSQLGPPKSPSPSNGSSASSSKKILGSTALGGFLRRKKSSLEDQEKSRQAKEEKAAQKEEARTLKKMKEEEKKREAKERKAPTPVSSVRARVQEIEAESADREGPPLVSPTSAQRLSTFASSTSLSSAAGRLRPASAVVVPSSPPQESEHHGAKEPASLSRLPSPLPSPTLASPEKADQLTSDGSDDPFLVDSASTPPAPPVFTPIAPPESSAPRLEEPTTPTALPAQLPILALHDSAAKVTTPALESAEEGHSAFVEGSSEDVIVPLTTPALEAVEEGEMLPEQSEADLTGAGEEVAQRSPGERRQASEASTVKELGTDEVQGPRSTSALEDPHHISAPIDELPPRSSTPPPLLPDTESAPILDSLKTPVKSEAPSQTTPRAADVSRMESPAVELTTPVKAVASPPRSDSPELRNSTSNNSMATSFATAASGADSASTVSDAQWEQAETEVRL